MTNFIRVLLVGVLVQFGWTGPAAAQDPPAEASMTIDVVEITGASRTNKAWVLSYLDLTPPLVLTQPMLGRIRAKLMTTDVFQRVRVSVQTGDRNTLVIDLLEKWTTIPVIRGAYGGGTPLSVLGVYDTHSFGRLWTLGAESHKYGPSPAGFVTWAKAPRWLTGKHVLGFELWREFRRRTIMTDDFDEIGVINTNTWMSRAILLGPVADFFGLDDSNWQAGIELELRREAPVAFESKDSSSADTVDPSVEPRGIRLSEQKSNVWSALPTGVWDNINIEDQDMAGTRLILKAGPLSDDVGTNTQFEIEAFQFFLWPEHWNLALHGVMGASDSKALQAQYFLGGFDSIRGLPDGAIYGTHAAWANAELRKLVGTWKYAKVQVATFVDGGGAGRAWKDVQDQLHVTAGAGVRIAIPQVYRLMFRFDYAWGLGGKDTHGLSAGLNQFFQPYKPL